MQITEDQGAVKISEVSCDDAQNILETVERQDGLTVINQFRNVITDIIKKQSYILFSRGEILWNDGNGRLEFTPGTTPTDIVFRMLQWEDSSRTVDLVMQGAATDDATHFHYLEIDPRELLYLEINRDLIRAGGGTIIVQNGVNGGAISGAAVMKKVPMSSTGGFPSIISTLDGTTTTTASIPLVMREDYTYNATLFSDLLWIPHGIRWPRGVVSTIGEVYAPTLEALPNFFVSTKDQLKTALLALQTTGGIVCLTQPILLDESITLYPNLKLTSRSWLQAPISVVSGVTISMQSRSVLENINIIAPLAFGSASPENIVDVLVSQVRARIIDCRFQLQNVAGDSNAIKVSGNQTRITNCTFVGVDAVPLYRTAINYAAGSGNADVDSIQE